MRLIDADALYKHKVYAETPEISGDFIPGFVIDKAPTIDAAPVTHSKWIHDINNLYGCLECRARETMSGERKKKYCSNCGAKMDAE